VSGAAIRNPACVLFDLDGTLVDTAPDLAHAANRVRGDAGLPPLPAARYRAVASAGARGLLKVALDLEPDDPGYAQRRDRFLEYYRADLARESRLFPGMEEALGAFERRGLPWGVVTNKPHALTEPLLAQLGLAARAGVVIGVVDGLAPKPAPDGLLRACGRLALAPAACVYVGDDRRDVAAARAAGIPVAAAAWGYLGEGEAVEDWQADAVLRTPSEMLAWCR
jgi:N-acetyl-D-muramate 6-phosphate phosphatase